MSGQEYGDDADHEHACGCTESAETSSDTRDLAAGTIRDALATVPAPDGDRDVVAAGLVADVTVESGAVDVALALGDVDLETAERVDADVRSAVLSTPGVERVDVERLSAEPAESALGPPAGATGLADVDRVVAVASAKGGVGKTTVAVQLARALDAEGQDVGLFDADLHGPNVPERLEVEGPVVADDEGRAKPVDADGVAVASVGLLAGEQPVAWRGAMVSEALTDLLTETAWGERDVLVVDCPPGTGDAVLTLLQSTPVDGAVLVTTPDPSAVGDTARTETLFDEEGVPVVGVVANMTAATCPSCGETHEVFPGGAVRDALAADLLAELPVDEALCDAEEPADRALDLAAAVDDRLATDRVTLPEAPLDLRGLPDRARRDRLATALGDCRPGESVWAVTDDPDGLRTAIDGVAGAEGLAPEVAIDRRGPAAWACRIDLPGGAAA